MEINYFALILILVADVISIVLALYMCRKIESRLLVIIGIACYNLSSCLGVILNIHNEPYLVSCILFVLFMVIVLSKIIEGKYTITINGAKDFFGMRYIGDYIKVVSVLGITCFIIIIISTFYPTNNFQQLSASSFAITGQRFALRLSRTSGLSWVMDRIKLVLLPFFFVWLYTMRENAKKFITVFLIYSFCDMLQNAVFTARSSYLQIIIFILIYLTLEHFISKRQLVFISIGIGLFGVVLMVSFKDMIMGIDANYNNLGDYFNAFLQSELRGGQARLEYCESVSGSLNFLHYLWHAFTAPLFFLPDDGFPTLSYYFTTGVLGLQYGQVGYYVILPGSFGEGVMIFGRYFAWIYGVFIGIYAGKFFKFLRSHEYLRYVYVYFLIQFGFAFRGSIQSFVLRSFNCLFYFLILFMLIKMFKTKKVSSQSYAIK